MYHSIAPVGKDSAQYGYANQMPTILHSTLSTSIIV